MGEADGIVTRATKVLRAMGVPANVLGYHYLRSAIAFAVKDFRTAIKHASEVLYPTVAEEYGTTASRVERSMRHAIDATWKNGNTDAISEYFGERGAEKRPTNTEFILTIADSLLLEDGVKPAV